MTDIRPTEEGPAAGGPTEGAPAAGSVLKGRYRLDAVVGQGGMAVVWRATDQLLERTVAVKVLRDQYARDPEFLTRFRSEAQAAAKLNDPGVVAVYDVGQDGERHFLVMEYVPGKDLKQIIREEAPLDPARAVRIAASLARAVGQAHSAGMVHRDVKPQNVLVGADGRMRVADFGIARAVADAGMTAPGIVLGTVHYLSPEQVMGASASPASDVYSLGVVLYEMLSGRVPYQADSGVGVAMKIAHEDHEPIDRLNPDVPGLLAGIVERAMAREPSERYANGTAMAEALEGYARWADQLTTPDFRSLAPAVAAAGRPPAPAAPAASVPAGATLDRTGLVLGFAALLALAMLIPLWAVVAERLGAAPGGAAPVQTQAPAATATASPPPVVMVEVPDVTGLPEAEAVDRVEVAGLRASTELDTDRSVPVGQVIRQLPIGGAIEAAGTVVKLTVSGEGLTAVPAASGDYETVAAAVTAAGLVPRSPSYRWGGTAGQVMSISPAPGTRLPFGAPVEIVVGSGARKSIGVDFEDNLFLSAVDLARAEFAPGETLSFAPYWEAVGPISGEYAVRALLQGPDGVVVSQNERASPAADGRPTTAWVPGESLGGPVFDLVIPPSATPGDYSLWLDIYRVGNAEDRLAVRGEGLAEVRDNQVLVATVSVQAPAPN